MNHLKGQNGKKGHKFMSLASTNQGVEGQNHGTLTTIEHGKRRNGTKQEISESPPAVGPD